jgi:hypothetical protein
MNAQLGWNNTVQIILRYIERSLALFLHQRKRSKSPTNKPGQVVPQLSPPH